MERRDFLKLGTTVANKGAAVDFPDFTRGRWKTNAPLEIFPM